MKLRNKFSILWIAGIAMSFPATAMANLNGRETTELRNIQKKGIISISDLHDEASKIFSIYLKHRHTDELEKEDFEKFEGAIKNLKDAAMFLSNNADKLNLDKRTKVGAENYGKALQDLLNTRRTGDQDKIESFAHDFVRHGVHRQVPAENSYLTAAKVYLGWADPQDKDSEEIEIISYKNLSSEKLSGEDKRFLRALQPKLEKIVKDVRFIDAGIDSTTPPEVSKKHFDVFIKKINEFKKAVEIVAFYSESQNAFHGLSALSRDLQKLLNDSETVSDLADSLEKAQLRLLSILSGKTISDDYDSDDSDSDSGFVSADDGDDSDDEGDSTPGFSRGHFHRATPLRATSLAPRKSVRFALSSSKDDSSDSKKDRSSSKKDPVAVSLDDAKKFFLGFDVSLVDKGESVKVWGRIPRACAEHFDFSSNDKLPGESCDKTLAIIINDKTGNGLKCIEEIWPNGAELGKNLCDPSKSGGTECVTLNRIAKIKDSESIKLAHFSSDQDSYVCSDIPSLNYEGRNTKLKKIQEGNEKEREEKGKLRNENCEACIEGSDFAGARVALNDLFNNLKQITKPEYEKRMSEINEKELEQLLEQVAGASVDELDDLLTKLKDFSKNEWIKKSADRRAKLLRAVMAIAKRYGEEEQYDSALNALTLLEGMGSLKADEKAKVKAYRKELLLAEVQNLASEGGAQFEAKRSALEKILKAEVDQACRMQSPACMQAQMAYQQVKSMHVSGFQKFFQKLGVQAHGGINGGLMLNGGAMANPMMMNGGLFNGGLMFNGGMNPAMNPMLMNGGLLNGGLMFNGGMNPAMNPMLMNGGLFNGGLMFNGGMNPAMNPMLMNGGLNGGLMFNGGMDPFMMNSMNTGLMYGAGLNGGFNSFLPGAGFNGGFNSGSMFNGGFNMFGPGFNMDAGRNFK